MGGCNAIAIEHGRHGLSCMQKLWSAQAVLNLYGILECKLCCEILLLMNMAGILYAESCGVSSGVAASSSMGVLNEVTIDLLLLAALKQFKYQATDRLLPFALEGYIFI